MGFDSTGPFVLTLYRIVSKNVPFFLQFYVIILVGFACALSLLTNNGNPLFHYGFWHFILIIWTLTKSTVGLGPSNDALNVSNISNDIFWIYDVISTLFSIIVVLLMVNLLIAIISGKYLTFFMNSVSFFSFYSFI